MCPLAELGVHSYLLPTPPSPAVPHQPRDHVTYWGQSGASDILCPLLKYHKEVAEQSQ